MVRFGAAEFCGRSENRFRCGYWSMIPKIQSAVQTVQAGVEQVIIGDNLTDGTIIKE